MKGEYYKLIDLKLLRVRYLFLEWNYKEVTLLLSIHISLSTLVKTVVVRRFDIIDFLSK